MFPLLLLAQDQCPVEAGSDADADHGPGAGDFCRQVLRLVGDPDYLRPTTFF